MFGCQRKLIFCPNVFKNGIIFQFVRAVEYYREILFSVEEHQEKFRTDPLQMLHTLHNLKELLEAKHEGIPPTLRDDQMPKQVGQEYT